MTRVRPAMWTSPKNCNPSAGPKAPVLRRFLEHHLRAEAVVEFRRAAGRGVQGPGNELPEAVEVGEPGLGRVVIVGGGVVDVGGEPDGVLHPVRLQGAEQVGDLVLAAERRPVSLRNRLEPPRLVAADQPDRHVGGDHLPGGGAFDQLALQPGQLPGAEEGALGPGADWSLAPLAAR